MERDTEIGASRQGDDMRLSVFHYPLRGWTDAVVMNVLMGLATVIQLDELSHVSYQPLAEAFRAIRLRELRHQELGVQGLNRIVASNEQRDLMKSSVEYWRPRIAASFGHSDSKRFETQSRFGLRHKPNETLLAEWVAATEQQLGSLGLN